MPYKPFDIVIASRISNYGKGSGYYGEKSKRLARLNHRPVQAETIWRTGGLGRFRRRPARHQVTYSLRGFTNRGNSDSSSPKELAMALEPGFPRNG